MMAPRRVEPEWLDELAPRDPRARRSRLDLRRINRFMGHAATMADLLLRTVPAQPRSLLELGCGDGSFMLRVARRLARHWPHVAATLVDRHSLVDPATRSGFAAIGWNLETVTADVFQALDARQKPVDIITANLFLHHFEPPRLAALLTLAAKLAPAFVACEPRRSLVALAGSHLLWAIGCNGVSRHDARLSVRAGFRDTELSAVWAGRDAWELVEARRGLFTHAFAARRRVP